MDTDHRCRPRLHERARRGDRHEPGEHAVHHHAGVRLAHPLHAVEHRRSVAPNAAAIAVFTATTVKRRSVAESVDRGIEPEPAEQQDERAQHRHRDAVRGQRSRLAVGAVLADAGTEHDRAGQAGDATHRVHHTGAGEVDVAEPEVDVVAELAEPTATPGPPTEDRVVERAAEQAPADERLPLPPLGHRAGRDGRGGVHERDHVEEERRDRDAVRDAGQREAAPAPQERPVTEADQPIGAQRRVDTRSTPGSCSR